MRGPPPHLGSVSRANRRLQSRIVAMLSDHDCLTAMEIAASAYGPRVIVRRGWHRRASPARLSAVRRVLRRLVRKGRVMIVGVQRRRNIFAIFDSAPFPELELGRSD